MPITAADGARGWPWRRRDDRQADRHRRQRSATARRSSTSAASATWSPARRGPCARLRGRRAGQPADRDPGARGRDCALRLRRRRRARLVPPADTVQGVGATAGAGDPLGVLGRTSSRRRHRRRRPGDAHPRARRRHRSSRPRIVAELQGQRPAASPRGGAGRRWRRRRNRPAPLGRCGLGPGQSRLSAAPRRSARWPRRRGGWATTPTLDALIRAGLAGLAPKEQPA